MLITQLLSNGTVLKWHFLDKYGSVCDLQDKKTSKWEETQQSPVIIQGLKGLQPQTRGSSQRLGILELISEEIFVVYL